MLTDQVWTIKYTINDVLFFLFLAESNLYNCRLRVSLFGLTRCLLLLANRDEANDVLKCVFIFVEYWIFADPGFHCWHPRGVCFSFYFWCLLLLVVVVLLSSAICAANWFTPAGKTAVGSELSMGQWQKRGCELKGVERQIRQSAYLSVSTCWPLGTLPLIFLVIEIPRRSHDRKKCKYTYIGCIRFCCCGWPR